MLAHRPAPTADTSAPSLRGRFDWEDADCPLCGRDDAGLFCEAPDPTPADGPGLRFAVVRCNHCGTAYTNPRPTRETISHFYPHDYEPHRRAATAAAPRPASAFWSRVFGRPCPERRGRFPSDGAKRLLDFGCGGGGFLARMAALGWRVTGLDVAEDVVEAVRREHGFDAVAGTLPHPDLPPASFDVVTMWQSLEHVHDPLTTLRAALRLLAPGGWLVVAVPNFEGFSAGQFGEHWIGLDLPRHLTHFTAGTLREMLRAAGFRVRSVRGVAHADWLRSSARRAAAAGSGGTAARLLSRKPVAKLTAWASYALGKADALVAVAQRPE
ncbi:MAG TPA: class I SAM-dependent methyltransferase [Gemmata sp.]|nr:class I SAM-dependent methyltransferase [Gemmata sp.]